MHKIVKTIDKSYAQNGTLTQKGYIFYLTLCLNVFTSLSQIIKMGINKIHMLKITSGSFVRLETASTLHCGIQCSTQWEFCRSSTRA